MPKLLAALFSFTVIFLALSPFAARAQNPSISNSENENNIQTEVLVDPAGNIHALWFIPAMNRSSTPSGVWYGKFSRNGTSIVPIALIVNSTRVQSSDIAVDSRGNAAIVWTEMVDNSSLRNSILYLLRFNSTKSERTQIQTTRESLALWPTVALGENGTAFLAWTQYTSDDNRTMLEYATVSNNRLSHIEIISTFTQLFMPKARLTLDQPTGHILIAWRKNQLGDKHASTVDYATLLTNGTVLMKLQIAGLNETVQDLSITPTAGRGGAYVVWETDARNSPVYVSQISSIGQLVYLRKLDYPNAQAGYLAASTDSQGNLYVFSYQPSILNLPKSQTTQGTRVTYLRISSNGDIIQSGSQRLTGYVFAVTTATDGDLYAISTNGIITIATSRPSQINWQVVCALVASIATVGAFSIEEGRYKLLLAYSKMPWIKANRRADLGEKVVHLLGRKPGLGIRELNNHIEGDRVSLFSLTRMEKLGMISSFRDRLSRRFYVKNLGDSPVDPIASRILLRIAECPGTWEAQLARNLGLSQQLVHYHLRRLRDSKMVASNAEEGSRKLYWLVGKTHEQPQSAS
jgi:DNA-binding transcriptional ArsR family regulator